MAVASAWSKPGSWALAAEEQDELPPPPPPFVPAGDFPDLATAATTKVPKKKKAQPIPLAEFNTGKFVSRRPAAPEVISDLDLPKGPRERTEEELANARGFGAARWGAAGGGPRGGSDEPRRDREDLGPSRADEADDWGAGKKPLERRERMGGFGLDSSAPRADDVQDWASTKRTTAPAPFPERRERLGGGFGGDSHSRADDSGSWVSNKSSSAPAPADGKRVWGFNRDASADADSWSRTRREEMSNVGGSSAGRPRLNLQKRTLPLVNCTDGDKQLDKNEDNKEKGEQITGSRSSNPFGAARPREEVLAAKGEDCREEPKVDKLEIQPRTRSSNPFGAARPREEVLAEKGEDWRKIDQKLEAMKVREVIGWRGSPVAGEENGSAQKPDAVGAANESEEGSEENGSAQKPDAVEAANESEEGSDN